VRLRALFGAAQLGKAKETLEVVLSDLPPSGALAVSDRAIRPEVNPE
jgi:hypothetical protein